MQNFHQVSSDHHQASEGTPIQNNNMGSMAKDLGSFASISTMGSKSKKNKLSKKRRDALKKRNEKLVCYNSPHTKNVADMGGLIVH